jgi:hypothetical protein
MVVSLAADPGKVRDLGIDDQRLADYVRGAAKAALEKR